VEIEMLIAEEFSKYFGSVCALKEVGLSLPDGQILGLIGPNGAGKTTFLQGLAGLLPMSSGRLAGMEFKFHFEIGQSYCSIWRTELLHILIFPSVLSLIFMQRSSDAGATRGMKHLRGLTFQVMPPTGLNLSQKAL